MRQRVVLGLLADPEDAQRHEAHDEGQQPGAEQPQRMREIGFAVDAGQRRRTDVEHQHRHREGEDAVGQRGQAFAVAAGDAVVERGHAESGVASARPPRQSNGVNPGA